MWKIPLEWTRQTAWIKVSFFLNLSHVMTTLLSELKDDLFLFFFFFFFNQQLIWVSNWFLVTAEYFCASCCVNDNSSFIGFVFVYKFLWLLSPQWNKFSTGLTSDLVNKFKACTCISTRNTVIFFCTYGGTESCQWKSAYMFPHQLQVMFEVALYCHYPHAWKVCNVYFGK